MASGAPTRRARATYSAASVRAWLSRSATRHVSSPSWGWLSSVIGARSSSRRIRRASVVGMMPRRARSCRSERHSDHNRGGATGSSLPIDAHDARAASRGRTMVGSTTRIAVSVPAFARRVRGAVPRPSRVEAHPSETGSRPEAGRMRGARSVLRVPRHARRDGRSPDWRVVVHCGSSAGSSPHHVHCGWLRQQSRSPADATPLWSNDVFSMDDGPRA